MKPFQRINGNLYELYYRPPAERKAMAEALFTKGVLAGEQGAMDCALCLYHDALRIDRTHAPAWVNRGTIYYNHHKRRQAWRCYQHAVESDPRHALAWFNLGNVFDDFGKRKESIECYLKSLFIDPQRANTHFNIALVYQRTGEKRKAIKHFELYCTHVIPGPDDSTVYAVESIAHLKAVDLQLIPKPPTGVNCNENGHVYLMEG